MHEYQDQGQDQRRDFLREGRGWEGIIELEI